jgi:asparagine synthetase B (glutamine-hydrolysing)
MPGLFGIIPLNESIVSNNEEIRANFNRMENRLAHEQTEIFSKEEFQLGKANIGKIGQKSLFIKLRYEDWDFHCFGFIKKNPASKNWIHELNGSFSLLAYNSKSNEYHLVADRISSQPIYYFWNKNYLYFSPEVKALTSIPGSPKKINFSALGSLIASGHLLNGQTLYQDIHSLGGGKNLCIKGQTVDKQSYWRFSPGVDSKIAPEGLLEILSHLIKDSVGYAFSGNNNSALFLSGGVDSRALLGSYLNQKKAINNNVCTVSWGLNENQKGSDAYIGREMASKLSLSHIFLERSVENFGENFSKTLHLIDWHSDVPAFHSNEFLLMQQLRFQNIKTVIRGDETFGWKKLSRSDLACLSLVGLRPFKLIRGLESLINKDIRDKVCTDQEVDFAGFQRKNWADFSHNQLKDYLYFTQRLQTYLNTASYYKMYYFLHYNPLLDYDILDFIRYIPDDQRVNKSFFKNYVKTSYQTLRDFPYATESGLEQMKRLVYSESPIRKYIHKQISDLKSDVWNIFQHDEIKKIYESESYASRTPSLGDLGVNLMRTYGRLTSANTKCHYDAARELAQPIPSYKLLLRFLIVKDWLDQSKPSFTI